MLAIYFAVGALAAECKDESQTSTCAQCEMVGTIEVCMQCKTNGYAPIDGICTNVGDELTAAGCQDSSGQSPTTTAKCAKCTKVNYFLFQGGCYKVGQEPGSLVCTDALGSNTDKPGVCKACAEGYFTNTQATETQESCVACGDENCATCTAGTDTNKCTRCAEGYFVGAANNAEGPCVSCSSTSAGSGGWTGVTGCAKCTKPAAPGTVTCDECTTDYLKTESAGATSCVTAENCGEGYFATTVGSVKKCVSCSDNNNGITDCGECTAPSEPTNKPTCTKCTTPNYLKTAADGTTTCIEKTACKDDFFPKEDNSNGHKCLSCGDETSGVPNCAECTAPSQEGEKPACSECGSGYKLEGGACVSSSANRSGLSSGAIAGIFITAVVVMGGLVDFFSRAVRL
ncbi:Variant-specific surface protein [Giardia duodenalis]|uniref:Variant-specific surface protein n=1 Tax=Giardia intestinalis TaxID=5741 RepID=V6TWF1_GIAIN|nr:Variant-specific surface protein [Giardia intestinalis]